MTYWRMQLHPDESNNSIKHTTESVSAGFIGLGFGQDPGDLKKIKPSNAGVILDKNEDRYWQFAEDMEIGDIVAIFCHNQPFALTKITGNYNYIKTPVPNIGVWFNHFRTIDITYTQFYPDLDRIERSRLDEFIKDTPHQMTIQRHGDSSKDIYKFIENWANL